MSDRVRTIEIEDLVGSRVVDADGERVGHVVDLLLSGLPRPEVAGLAVGSAAWLSRLELDDATRRLLGRPPVRVVAWRHVDGIDERRVIRLRRGWSYEADDSRG